MQFLIQQFQNIDTTQLLTMWLLFEQYLASSKTLEANCSLQLITHIVDAVITCVKSIVTSVVAYTNKKKVPLVEIILILSCLIFSANANAVIFNNMSTGFHPGAAATASFFSFNGKTSQLLQGGVALGAAYVINPKGNVDSFGIYISPTVSNTTTSLAAMIQADLFRNSTMSMGIGIRLPIWENGKGTKAFTWGDSGLTITLAPTAN